MMSSLFRMILQMSITASYVIAAVLVFRMLLRNYPKKYSYYLWSAVLFRLCCPFSFSSVFSIFNFSLKKGEDVIIDLTGVPVSSGTESQSISQPIDLGAPQITETIRETFTAPAVNTPVPAIPSEVTASPSAHQVSFATVLLIVWVAGAASLLIYALIKYLRMRKELRFSVPLRDNIRQADIESPFLMGLLKPVIYVPFDSDGASLEMSIAHERYHIQRKDHWIRVLAFLLFCIHWMNPLCWVAYYLMIKDMEMSCDEHVIEGDKDLRTAYSDALLNYATEKKTLPVGSMYFGGSNVKDRIKNVLNFRNANRMKTVFAVLMCMLMLASCAFNGKVPAALDPQSSGSIGNGTVFGSTLTAKPGQMQDALGGAAGAWSVTTENGIYYLDTVHDSDDAYYHNIVYIDYKTNQKKYLCSDKDCTHDSASCSSYVEWKADTILSDAKKDCLLTMWFSMDEGFVINRMNLDGTGKREIIRLEGYVLDYFDKTTIQTLGSKLYFPLRKGESRELIEVDVDAETAKTIYTFSPEQFVFGGYGENVILRTLIGKTENDEETAAFTPIRRYRYEALNVNTGEIEMLLEADLPYVNYYCGFNVMAMTWEEDHYAVHVYDLSTGTETVKEFDSVPDDLLDEPNRTMKWISLGEALDDTHFTLIFSEFEKDENGELVMDNDWPVFATAHYCVVDTKNERVFAAEDVYRDAPVEVPINSIIFAETDSSFYMAALPAGDPVLYVIPRNELLTGHVVSMATVAELNAKEFEEVSGNGEMLDQLIQGKAPELSKAIENLKTVMENLKTMTAPEENSMYWPLNKLLIAAKVQNSKAVDFISSPGMDVIASYEGIVVETGNDDEEGIYLVIAHNGGIMTVYSHLKEVDVAPGTSVAKGDVVGKIGAMVDTVGAHMYFRVFVDGKEVDPDTYCKGKIAYE